MKPDTTGREAAGREEELPDLEETASRVPLGDKLVSSHEPDRGGQARGRRNSLDERRHHIQIKRPRIYLPNRVEHSREAKMFGDYLLEIVHRAV